MGHLTRYKLGHFARYAIYAIDVFPKRETAIILFIFLFHAVTNALVVSSHMAPFTGDEAMFMEQSWYFLQAFIDGQYTKIVSISDYHPPLQRLLAVPFYLLFGYSPAVAVMSMFLASLVLIISVYHIGKELHSKDAGLLAAALTVLLPGVFAFSRSFVEEFPLTALVALSLALILKTKHFSHRDYTLAFGASVGLGILCKWSFSLYAIGPFIVYALISVRQVVGESDNPARDLLRRGAWLLLAVFIGLALASWWYLPNLNSVAENFKYFHLNGEEDVASAPLRSSRSPRAFLFYAEALLSGQLGWPMALTALISCIFLLRGERKATSFLISWIVIPLLILIAITPIRDGRHSMPTLPAAALLILMGCMTLQPPWRKVCVPAVMLIALSQFFIISFMENPTTPDLKRETGLRRADADNWGTDEIASTITSLLSTQSNVTVMLLPGFLFNHHTIGYLQKAGTFPSFELIDAKHCIDTGYGCGKTYEEYLQMFDMSDVIIGEVVKDFKSKGPLEEEYSRLLDAWNNSTSEFPYVSVRVLPDTSQMRIYTRVPYRSSMTMERAEREHTVAQGDAN